MPGHALTMMARTVPVFELTVLAHQPLIYIKVMRRGTYIIYRHGVEGYKWGWENHFVQERDQC